jgi:hypothetical protein
MRIAFFFFFLISMNGYSQEWILVDVVKQTRKEVVYRLDDGKKVKKVKHDSPSIINLISTIEEEGYKLEKITQGIELDLEGNLPVIRNNIQQNFGITTLTLDNNNRVMLWFKKK